MTLSHAPYGTGHAGFVLAAFRLAVMMLAHTQAVCRYVPGLNLDQAWEVLKAELANDPDGEDKLLQAAKFVGKQVLLVSPEILLLCTRAHTHTHTPTHPHTHTHPYPPLPTHPPSHPQPHTHPQHPSPTHS